jgi:hypothetical protein
MPATRRSDKNRQGMRKERETGPDLDFIDFTLGLEFCFQRLLDHVSKEPPRNAIAAAVYKHIPISQSVLGRRQPIGYLWFNEDVVKSIKEAGTAIPGPPARVTPGDYDNLPNRSPVESARILGRIEEALGSPINVVFANWLKETRRRETGITRTLFCHELAIRAAGFEATSMDGVGDIPRVTWSPSFDASLIECFADGAGGVIQGYAPEITEHIARLEGARVAGNLETVNGRDIDTIYSRIYGTSDGTVNPNRARDLGKAVTSASLGNPSTLFDVKPDARPKLPNLRWLTYQTHKWAVNGAAKDYTVWTDGEVFQITKGEVPRGIGGYKMLDPLLTLKNISRRDFTPADEETGNVRAVSAHAPDGGERWSGMFLFEGDWQEAADANGTILYPSAAEARNGALVCRHEMETNSENEPVPHAALSHRL